MTEYRYVSTDLITGAVNSDWLPLTVTSFSRQINAAGQLTGALNLTAGTAVQQAGWRAALEPRRSVLWVLMDNVPVWNGIVWDWSPESALDGNLPVSASTMDSLFTHRYLTSDLSFQGQDVFGIFRSLASYALGKGTGAGVANLALGSAPSGIADTISYTAGDQQQVYTAWTDLVAAYGFEFAFRPGFDANGTLVTYLDLGYPELGQQFPASRLYYNFPGDLLDYQFTRTGASSGNAVLATASDTTPGGDGTSWISAQPHGYDSDDIADGYPLLEYPVTLTGIAVTSQATIDSFADGYLSQVTGTMLAPLLTHRGSRYPGVKDIVLGSWCQVALTSALHPALADGSPGFQGTGRITGWTVNPPAGSSQQETVQIQTWMPGEAGDEPDADDFLGS